MKPLEKEIDKEIKKFHKNMEKSLKKIKEMRPEVIENTIAIEDKLDEIIIREFKIVKKFPFRVNFLYGNSPISFRKKIEVFKKIQDEKYKKLGEKIDKIRVIRNIFAHSPSGGYANTIIIYKYIKQINAKEKFNEFNKLYKKCLFSLDKLIVDMRTKTKK